MRRSDSIKAVIEHGVPVDDYIWSAETLAMANAFLAVTSKRGQLLSSNSGKVCVPIGFSFLYAMNDFSTLYPTEDLNASRTGTVVFPAHSSHHIIAEFDYQSYADELIRLPDKYHPVVVCMYWKDWLIGRARPFLDRGLPVVSAGHIYDDLFQYRLYDICRHFRFATSNILGTHLFSSVKAGCSFFLTGRDCGISYSNLLNMPFEASCSNPTETKRLAHELFNKPVNLVTSRQLEFVDSCIGTAYFRGKKEMRSILCLLDIYDKLPSLSSAAKLGPRFLLPPYLHRRVSRAVRRFRKHGN